MGLVGKLKRYTYSESEEETETVKVTYPKDMSEYDPNYEFRGQEVEQTVPKIIETLDVLDNVYLHIHSYNVWKVDSSEYDLVNICYRVFESKEARDNDQNSFLFEEHLEHQNIDYSLEIGQLEQCYLIVKNLFGYEELIND